MSYLAAFHHYPILHALRNEIESLFYFHLFAEVRNLKRAPRHHAQHFEDGNDLHLIALEVYRVEHPVQHKARAHFGDTAGTFGDNHKVDDDEDDKHHDTDGEVTAHQEVTERFNHLSCRGGTRMPFHQDDTG